MTKGKAKPEKAQSVNEPTEWAQDIVAPIAAIIEKAGDKGVSKEEIYLELKKKFPYDKDAIQSAVDSIVPTRLSREVFVVEKTQDGKYRKAKN